MTAAVAKRSSPESFSESLWTCFRSVGIPVRWIVSHLHLDENGAMSAVVADAIRMQIADPRSEIAEYEDLRADRLLSFEAYNPNVGVPLQVPLMRIQIS
jgi:hypothetical protein